MVKGRDMIYKLYIVDRYIQLCTFTDSIELYNF